MLVAGGRASLFSICTGFTGPMALDKGWSYSSFGTTRDGGQKWAEGGWKKPMVQKQNTAGPTSR